MLNPDDRAFQNRIDDRVDTENIVDPYDTRNGKAKACVNRTEVRQQGVKYQLRCRPTAQGGLVLSQSWVSTDSDARHTFSLLAAQPIAGLGVSLGYYRVDDMRWTVGDYHSKHNRLDLRLAKDWKTADGRITTTRVLQSRPGDEYERFSEYRYKHQKRDQRGYLRLIYVFK